LNSTEPGNSNSLSRSAYEWKPPITNHRRILKSNPYDCHECGATFNSTADLLNHARRRGHKLYACECSESFFNFNIFNRHLKAFGTAHPQYPCNHCKDRTGLNGFYRFENLRNHIRSFHGIEEDQNISKHSRLHFPICPYDSCPQHRDGSYKTLSRTSQYITRPFKSQSTYSKHMREKHNESSFSCDVPGCPRISPHGYSSERGFWEHRSREHGIHCPVVLERPQLHPTVNSL